jgi:hypothetical protein
LRDALKFYLNPKGDAINLKKRSKVLGVGKLK